MNNTIQVSNLPKTAKEPELHSIFVPFGNIVSISQTKNVAKIQFEEIEDAQEAIENMNGFEYFGNTLIVGENKDMTSVIDKLSANTAIWDQPMEEAT